MNIQKLLVPLLIALAAAAQMAPHPFNVSPVATISLFAGAQLSPRVAWLVPLAALLPANLLVIDYPLPVLVCVYLGMLAAPLMGRLLLARQRNSLRFGAATLSAAAVFYLVSNFGVWLAGMYPATLNGLAKCYLMGLPYLGRSLLGDLIYGAAIFGAWSLARPTTDEPTQHRA